jgi:choline dehydrogenase-like flavoprotein
MTGKIHQFDTIKPGRMKTEVVVMGSGCGGATVARQLQKRGWQVTIVEQGGYSPTASFDNNELNMAGKVSADRNMMTSNDGAYNLLSGDNVGGASVHYWADSYRTPDDRLELWEKQFGVRGHMAKDLKPAFDELDKRLNVHPATDEYLNTMNRLLEAGAKKLGWRGHRVPQARQNCQKSGHCMQGCAFGAKQSQLVTHIEDFIAAGGELYADTRAKKLEFGAGSVRSLTCVVIDRPRAKESATVLEIEARAFVVAMGGFSSSAFFLSQGLGGALPVLGKYIAMNPSPIVHALYQQPVVQWRNIPAGFGIDQFRLATYKDGQYVEGGYLLMPNQLQPATLAAMLPGYGRDHFEWMEMLPHIGGTIGWIDDVPVGYIEVEGNRRKLHYTPGETNKAILRDLLKKQVLVNFAAGAQRVMLSDLRGTEIKSPDDLAAIDRLEFEPGSFAMACPHPAGGCRMGENPQTSVVNSEHRVHGIKNLYVADPSVFPTAVSVDPSYTIMAFSYIAAQSIDAALRKVS